MKVGIMAGVYHPEIGGSGTYLRRLRDDLIARGDEVEVVTYGEIPSEPGVVRVSRRFPVPLRLAIFAFHAVRRLRGCDVWYVNDYGLVATLLAPFFRTPMVMKVIGDWAWESGVNAGLVDVRADASTDPLLDFQRRRHPLKVQLRKVIRTICARAMDRVLVPSKYLGRVVRSWGVADRRIAVVYNAMALEPAARVPREDGLVLAAARLTAWKGMDHLIEALAVVRASVPTVRLVILGDGPERAHLEALARESGVSEHVTFAGLVSRDVVREHMARAAVFALPSAYEGLPHVVLEALAMGAPVVAAACGGTVEVVREGVDGHLVPYGDVPALSAAIAGLLTDPIRARAYGSAGAARVAAEFTWQRTSEGALRVLDEVARRDHRNRGM